jgi:hypothetical protein
MASQRAVIHRGCTPEKISPATIDCGCPRASGRLPLPPATAIIAILEVAVARAAVVEPSTGQHVITKGLVLQHLQYPCVGASALVVSGRRRSVAFRLVVIDEGIQQRGVGLVHQQGLSRAVGVKRRDRRTADPSVERMDLFSMGIDR